MEGKENACLLKPPSQHKIQNDPFSNWEVKRRNIYFLARPVLAKYFIGILALRVCFLMYCDLSID